MGDSFTEATQAFLAWLHQHNVRMSAKMAVVDMRSEGRGRGVVALEDIAEDEIIFSIPRTAVLNIKTGLPTSNDIIPGETSESIRSVLADMPPWLSLTALILSENALGQASKWFPYLSILPSTLDSLIFWSPEELKELQASAVVNKIGKSGSEEQYNTKISGLQIPQTTLEAFHTTASTIMSYAFDIPEEPVEDTVEEDELVDDEAEQTVLTMIPLADMLNADADRNNARLMCDNEELEMKAIKGIRKGEEIFNDYGQLPRSDLLRRYGYITDNYKTYDIVELSTDLITAYFTQKSLTLSGTILPPLTAAQIQSRLSLAEREDVLEESYDISHSDSEFPCLPDELLALIWILSINNETFSSLEHSKSSLPSRSKLTTSFVGNVIKHVLTAREGQYATTLEEDQALLQRGNLPHRTSMAVVVRHGEKEILREAMQEAATFQGDNKKMRGQSQTAKRGREEESSNAQKKSKRR